MLYQPVDVGLFFRACEADGYRGLVAAIIDNPGYEQAPPVERLTERLRAAHDLVLLTILDGRGSKWRMT